MALVQRAEPARQDGEGVGELEHLLLALVHAVDDVELVEPGMAEFHIAQVRGHDADHLAAPVEDGIGDDTHEADAAAAEDQAHVALGQKSAEFGGGFAVNAVETLLGAAINAERGEISHLGYRVRARVLRSQPI